MENESSRMSSAVALPKDAPSGAEIFPFPQLASLEARAEAWIKAQDEAVACLRILTQSVEFAILMGKLSPALIDSLLLKRCQKAIAECER